MEKPRVPLTWSDWVTGDWLGGANPIQPIGKLAPVVAESIDSFARFVGATLGAAAERGGPAAPQLLIQQILDNARSRLVGRELTLRFGAATVQLALDDLRFAASPLGLAIGQFGTITADAANVRWDGGRLNALTVKFKNVHVRPGTQPTLIVAPVMFHATIRQDVLDERIHATSDKVTVELRPDGTAIARRPGKEHWGSARVVPRIEGDNVRLVATGLTVGSKSFTTQRTGIPSVLLDIPPLPGGMRLIGIALADSCVEIDAVIHEWREPITAQQLVALSELVRSDAALLDFSRTRS